MLASKVILRGSAAAIGLRRIPLASRQLSSLRPSARPRIPKFSRALLPLTALRFNSTLPTPGSGGAESVSTISPYLLPDSELPSYIPSAESLAPVFPATEHIGFLKEVGLDYGIGPTSLLQYLLESVHVLSGSPWWVSIVLTVVVIRAVQFPFYMRMSETAARMKEVNPQVLVLSKRMREGQQRGDQPEMIKAQHMIRAVYRKAGVNRLWLAFPITQIPIFYGFYKNLFGMAELKVPGLIEGGNWWFHDLTAADPYYILPLVSSLSMGVQIGLGGEAGSTMQTKRMKQGMLLVLPLLSFTFVNSWPAALTLYFFTNSAFGLLQATLLRNAWVRDRLGLYPLSLAASQNPLAASALGVATGAGPAGKIIGVGAPKQKQIGGKGGFLDKITGGDVEKGEKKKKKKSLLDRVLGDKPEQEQGGLGQMWKDSNIKRRHDEHEKNYQRRVQEEAEKNERKRRAVGHPERSNT